MTTALTSGILISVDARYEERFSNPSAGLYLFSYGIEIENRNPYPIKLLSRYWKIVDSNSHVREVKGEGVIGEQPIIAPGESYSYRSSSDFKTDLGKMKGHYVMQNLESNHIFEVVIPEFILTVPYRLN